MIFDALTKQLDRLNDIPPWIVLLVGSMLLARASRPRGEDEQ